MFTSNGFYTYIEFALVLNIAFSLFLKTSNYFQRRVKIFTSTRITEFKSVVKAQSNSFVLNENQKDMLSSARHFFNEQLKNIKSIIIPLTVIFSTISVVMVLIIVSFLYLGREQLLNWIHCYILLLPYPCFLLILGCYMFYKRHILKKQIEAVEKSIGGGGEPPDAGTLSTELS